MLTGLIIVVSLMVIGSLVFIFWDKIIALKEKKFFTKEVGSKIYKIALENDYYLINDAVLSIDTKVIHFNHILFTNKFIYCIGVKYFNGPISGKYEDAKWLENFHSRIMSGTDPLALYRKARSSQVTHKPKQAKSTEYVYTEYKRTPSKPTGCLTYLVGVLLIIIVIALVITTL
jgi:hypothetical protein